MSHLQSQSCYVMGYWRYQGCKIVNKRERERDKGEKNLKYSNIFKKIQTFKRGYKYSILVNS
jgi:hypothetical protein